MDTGSVKYSFFIAIVALAFACSSSSGTSSTSLDIKFQPTSASWQDTYPGVESSLRFTRSYKVALQGYANDSILPMFILVDSVKIPIIGLTLNGKRYRGTGPKLLGEYESIEFYASRQFHTSNNGGPQFDPVVYDLSDSLLPDQHLAVEFKGGGRSFSIPAGEATVLETMYAP